VGEVSGGRVFARNIEKRNRRKGRNEAWRTVPISKYRIGKGWRLAGGKRRTPLLNRDSRPGQKSRQRHRQSPNREKKKKTDDSWTREETVISATSEKRDVRGKRTGLEWPAMWVDYLGWPFAGKRSARFSTCDLTVHQPGKNSGISKKRHTGRLPAGSSCGACETKKRGEPNNL